MKALRLISVAVILLGVSGMASAEGGNGNGGAGGGNAHGAATAGPTAGGDNTSTPGSSRSGKFHFKHKKKAPVAASQ
jgi:hypothetical protein